MKALICGGPDLTTLGRVHPSGTARNVAMRRVSRPLAVLLAICCEWLCISAFGVENLEMSLNGQIFRRSPHPSTALLTQTGSVGRIDLAIPDGVTAFLEPAGIFSFANDRGSFAVHAATSPFARTNSASVRWKGTFKKEAGNIPFTYTVNPSFLYLVAPNADPTNLFLASWQIIVRLNGLTNMVSERVIEGHPRHSGPTAFGLTTNTGPIETAFWDLDSALHDIEYSTRRYRGEVDLSAIPGGEQFTIEYEMNVLCIDTLGAESLAEAYLGDPLEYGTGAQMSYGAFGESFFLTQITLDPILGASLLTPFEPGFYFILCRTIGLNGESVPVAMQLGSAGAGHLVDPHPPTAAGLVLYTVKKIPLDQPVDSDGDGIHDVYELQHSSILDPLNRADASQDPDHDGYSNLTEFKNGTNPETPNAPTQPRLNFPGISLPTFPGGQLVDLNSDGVMDAVTLQVRTIQAALGSLGGTFQTPTNTVIAGAQSLSDAVYRKIDGDAFLDVVTVDLLNNQIYVLRGVGDGRFEPVGQYSSLGDPRKIALGDIDGDGRDDLAVLNPRASGVDLLLGSGDGNFVKTAAVRTNALGGSFAIALADLNQDHKEDLIVTLASAQLAVFLSQPTGGYGSMKLYPIGRSADSLAVGDLNNDGFRDVVTANRSSASVTVLMGAVGGVFQSTNTYPVAELPLGLQLADLNGDGFLEIVVNQVSADYTSVLPNQAGGGFGARYTIPAVGQCLDWNGDRVIDVVGPIGSGGWVTLGRGDGTFDGRLDLLPSTGPLSRVVPLDLNGDGLLELVGFNTQSNSVDVWEHAAVTGTNRFLSRFVVGPYVTALAHADFNGDGLMDLAVLTQTNSFNPRGSNQMVILLNQDGHSFTDAGRISFDWKPTALVVGDFNNDQRLDLVVQLAGPTESGGGEMVVCTGDGAGGFQRGLSRTAGGNVFRIAATDSSGLKRSELVLQGARINGTISTEFLEVWTFDNGQGWSVAQPLQNSGGVSAIQVTDWNRDGSPDLVVLNTDIVGASRSLAMYPGGPSGFGGRELLASEVKFYSLTQIADLDGDGTMDIVSGISLFFQKPTGGFYDPQLVWSGAGQLQEIGDFNRDGKVDLMSGLSLLLQK